MQGWYINSFYENMFIVLLFVNVFVIYVLEDDTMEICVMRVSDSGVSDETSWWLVVTNTLKDRGGIFEVQAVKK